MHVLTTAVSSIIHVTLPSTEVETMGSTAALVLIYLVCADERWLYNGGWRWQRIVRILESAVDTPEETVARA